jgi:ribosome recycling factor
LDLSVLEAEVLKAMEQLTHKLSQLRSGGRLNPDVVEALKVQLGTAGKDGDGRHRAGRAPGTDAERHLRRG